MPHPKGLLCCLRLRISRTSPWAQGWSQCACRALLSLLPLPVQTPLGSDIPGCPWTGVLWHPWLRDDIWVTEPAPKLESSVGWELFQVLFIDSQLTTDWGEQTVSFNVVTAQHFSLKRPVGNLDRCFTTQGVGYLWLINSSKCCNESNNKNID